MSAASAILFVFLVAIVVPVAVMILRQKAGYTASDFLALGLFLFPVLFLRRWNLTAYIILLGRPYMGFTLALVPLLGGLAVIHFVGGRHSTFRMLGLTACIAGLFLLGLLSGMINAGSAALALGAPLQADVTWILPLAVAYFGIKAVPCTLEHNERLRLSYVLVFGYLMSILALATALFTRQMSSLFGWHTVWAGTESGFARGFTPIGSTITSSFFSALAYCLCLGEILRKRRVAFHIVGAILCIGALLFSLSRSTMLVLVLVTFLMCWKLWARHTGKIVITLLVLAILAAPVGFALSRRYDFSRFVRAGRSIRNRYNSAMAAASLGLESPLGKGPGLFYASVRLPLREKGSGTKAVYDPIIIGDVVSAAEPHNSYLLFLAERGIAGLAIFATLFLLLFQRTRRACRLADWVPSEKMAARAYRAILISIAFFALTDSSPWISVKPALALWITIMMMLHHTQSMEAAVEQGELAAYEEPEYDEELPAYA